MSNSSGEKTEQPTQKRLKDARKKGQVSKSQDLSSALLLIVAVGFLWLGGNVLGSFVLQSVQEQFLSASKFQGAMTEKVVFSALLKGLISFALILTPIFIVVWIFAFTVNYLQVGSLFAPESIKPKFSKLNPAEGFKSKFFKLRPYVELAKTLLKMIITAVIAGYVFWTAKGDIVLLTTKPIDVATSYMFSLVIEIGFKVGIAFLILGAADFFPQEFLHRRDLKMTKHEVKEEFKETEGNPLIKSQRRMLHRELLSEGLASAVQKADVIVANPTHVAVALKYSRGKDAAPLIAAKGADLMAAQIRKLAKESNIPITRDIPLARALYELDVDDEIPEELFEAVAVVLRWVYQMSEERQAA